MARVVYKYTFKGETLEVPSGYIRLVAYQGGDPYPTVWVEHTLRKDGTIFGDQHTRQLRLFGTGHTIPDGFDSWAHVGSCVCGIFVWHVYVDASSRF